MSIAPLNASLLPRVQPPQEQKTYTVQHGDTIGGIASKQGVSTQDLIAKNPQISNPDALYPGDVLNIPEKQPKAAQPGKGSVTVNDDQSASAPGVSQGGATTEKTSKTNTHTGVDTDGKVSVGGKQTDTTKTTNLDGSESSSSSSRSLDASVDPSKGTFSVSAGTGFTESVKTSKGYGISFGVNTNATVVSGLNTKNGVTTFTSSGDVSVSLQGGASGGHVGLSAGHTSGIKSSFEVSMPEQAAKSTAPRTVSPFSPDSMPTGTVVKMDGSSYSTNEFKATFKHLATQTKVTDESGVSLLVEKTDTNKVRVTAGPKEAINAYNGVGIDFEVASIMLGRNDKLETAHLKTAEFDLSTPEGKAAYNDFLANGNMPENNGTGISSVKTIEKLDFSSQSRLDLKLGPVNLGLEGAKNTGNTVITRFPDGTAQGTVTLQYSGNVPMTVTQKFDASGKEVVSERRYSYTVKVDENSAQLLNVAQTGDLNKATSGPVKAGQTVTLTYTSSEMKTLLDQTAKAGERDPDLRALATTLGGQAASVEDFAISLARNLNGDDYNTCYRLFNISDGFDVGDKQYAKLPGQLTIG